MKKHTSPKLIAPRPTDSPLNLQRVSISPEKHAEFREAMLAAARKSIASFPEQLEAIRPDLDGNAIMAILGVPPGPVIGRAWAHLKEVRLDQGPLPPEAAEAELRRWWADQPESTP